MTLVNNLRLHRQNTFKIKKLLQHEDFWGTRLPELGPRPLKNPVLGKKINAILKLDQT
jgi:hypothetical protein